MTNTEVFFDADTSKFVAAIDKATGAVNVQSQAVAEAKNKIVQALNDQTEAARKTGASAVELVRIQTTAAKSLANVTHENATQVIAELDRISERQKRVASELQNLPKVTAPADSHGDDITNKQRASALLRGGGIRAGESFLTQFDAFNKLSTIVFPVLGLAAITKEAYHAVEAFKEMYDTAKKLPEVLTEGFKDLNSPLELGVDNLRKVNDQLEITNANLRHKDASRPAAALAIDEIRIAADNAATSARKAFLDVKKLLDENKAGFFGTLFTGTEMDAGLDDKIKAGFKKIEDLDGDHKDEVRAGRNTPESDATYRQARGLARLQLRADLDEEQRTRKGTVQVADGTTAAYSLVHGNQDRQLAKIRGAKNILDNQDDFDDETRRNLADQEDNKKLQVEEKNRAAAKAAKQKADEEARKADQKRFDGFKTREDVLKEYLPPDDVALDWEEFAKTFKTGSSKGDEAIRESASARASADREGREAAKQAAAKAEKDQRNHWDMDHDGWVTAGYRTAADESDYWAIRALEATAGSENERQAWDKSTQALLKAREDAERATKARSQASIATGQQKAAYDEAALAIQVQTGQISKMDAAQQLANIHAEQYRQKMADLQDELAAQKDPNSAGYVNAQAAIDKADADRKVQVMQDAASTAAASWLGSLKNANALWVQDAMDGGKQVSEFFGQAMSGLNENVENAVLRKKTDFGGMFQGLGKTLVGDGLKRIEAPVLSALGMGKADGSASNPFSVKIVGGAGGFGGGMADGLSGLFKSGSDDDDSGQGGGGFKGFLGGALHFAAGLFGGHRALGGGVKAGVTYDVGEMGREEFTPSQDGYITPNNRSSANSASYVIYTDGGVTSEQVHQQVTAALKAVHPQVVRDSATAVREGLARRPRSSGN